MVYERQVNRILCDDNGHVIRVQARGPNGFEAPLRPRRDRRQRRISSIWISGQAAVLDGVDRPIPGLFASGELTGGFFFINYPLGCGLTRGAVFGKLAGETAAVYVGKPAADRARDSLYK
jgi:hypothetical protein